MRPDMVKVIFDRGSRSKGKSRKTSRRLTLSETIEPEDFDDEDNDAGHSVQRRGWRDYSWPRTNPIKGWLRQQVGRPYAEVIGEMKGTAVSGYPYSNLASMMKWEIETDTVMVNGKVMQRLRYARGTSDVRGLYVHPETGRLCYAPEKKIRYGRKEDPNVIRRSDTLSHEKINGCWFEVTYRMVDDPFPSPYYRMRDSAKKAPQLRERVSQRQLNHRDIRTLGLNNG